MNKTPTEVTHIVLANLAFKNVYITKIWDSDDLKKWSQGLTDDIKDLVRDEFKRLLNERKKDTK